MSKVKVEEFKELEAQFHQYQNAVTSMLMGNKAVTMQN